VTQHHKNLADFLTQTGTTQQDFASKLGISAAHLSRLVNGERTASLPLALRIASEASIPIESLLPAPGTETPPVEGGA
jgi:transcriptional regulator with XRE-family HTH domain